MTGKKANPLLENYNLPPFNAIKNEHFEPAIKKAIKQAKKEIEDIKSTQQESTFENTIVALEQSGGQLKKVSTLFFNLNSANTSEKMQALAQKIAPQVTKYNNDILLDEKLFEKIKKAKKNAYKNITKYTNEEKILIDNTYKEFVRNGAELNADDKKKMREYSLKLATLCLTFGENLLRETNDYQLVIKDEGDLKGVPKSIKEYYKQQAIGKGKQNAWLVTLDYPSYVPFMTYAEDRNLRKELYTAFTTRCSADNKNSNIGIIKEIADIRRKKSQLLGYKAYADFVLEERMAKSTANVQKLIEDLYTNVLPLAIREKAELEKYVSTMTDIDLKNWDIAFYSEKLKKAKHGYDQEALRQYFPLEQTVKGIFEVANRLYSISFVEVGDVPKYHEEVTVYEVYNEDNELIAYFYTDFFPREGKRQGAWMTAYQGRAKFPEDRKPQVSIVCNFTRSYTGNDGIEVPCCLTFNEVKTLFHEFGHALHNMLADSVYGSLSGTNVLWDFVELPSQIMENWCKERECLDLFARHYKSGEVLRGDEIERVVGAEKFQQGIATLRQLSYASLDMAWHTQTGGGMVDDIFSFERNYMSRYQVFKASDFSCLSTSFAHIFQGGYAAGYYSYKWAEVLDADAFEYFEEAGIFDEVVSNKFKCLLGAGGSEEPMVLYKRFRGREPHIGALLRRIGL